MAPKEKIGEKILYRFKFTNIYGRLWAHHSGYSDELGRLNPELFYLFWKEIIRTKRQQHKSDKNHTQEKHAGPSWGLSGIKVTSRIRKREREMS